MKTKLILGAVSLAILLTSLTVALPAQTRPQPASAATSDKYDGDCTGLETAGRCSDKCPAVTSEGVYNQIGTDPTTGAALCKMAFYHACPYTDAVSADDPMCYKSQPAEAPADTTTPATTPPANSCWGK